MRVKSRRQQALDAELELIIEDFANAMRNADREFVSRPLEWLNSSVPHFTPHMERVWAQYIEFCGEYPNA